jgi:hypothetical protein
MTRSGRASRRVEQLREVGLVAALEAARGIDDLRAAAVVEGHEQRDALVAVGLLLRPAHLLEQLGLDALAAADEAHAHALGVQLRRLGEDALGEHPIRALTSSGGTRPVLRRERVDRQLAHAEVAASRSRALTVSAPAWCPRDREPRAAAPSDRCHP